MNFSYESILPIAPLKIAALEGCRELAETMDKYLVEFRQKSNQEFQNQPNFHGYHEDTYLIKTEKPKALSMNLSAVRICLFWQM